MSDGPDRSLASTFEIRRARVADVAAVADLLSELGYPTPGSAVADRLSTMLRRTDEMLVVADSGGSVIGWAHMRIANTMQTGPFAELTGLVVFEEHRGRGIGMQLVGAAEAWAVEQGLEIVRVRSRSSRERTHRFYEGLGYERVKEQVLFSRSV